MTSDTPRHGVGRGSAWKLSIITLAHVVGTANIVSVLAMAPVIQRDLDLSVTQFGLLVTAYNGAQAAGALPAGGLVDRLGVGWVLALALVIVAAATAMLGQATDFTFALGSVAVMGLGYSLVNPATARGVLEWFPPERRATAMGVKQTGVPLGGILAAGNGALAAFVGWQSILGMVAGATALGAVLCLWLAERPQRQAAGSTPGVLAGLRRVMGDWNLGRFVAMNGLYNMGQANFFAYLTLFMRQAAQASLPVAGLCLGIAQASSAVARIGWGVVSDTFFRGRRKVLVVVLGAVATVFLAAMAAVGPGWGVVLGAALALALGATIGSYAGLSQTMAVEATEPRLAGSAMGYTMIGTSLGGMIGPPVFGAIVDLSGAYANGWLFSAALLAAGTLLLGLGFRERR